MFKTFKKIFYEFYLDNCMIMHTIDLKIIIKNNISNTTIIIPPYIDFTLLNGKKTYSFDYNNSN